MTALQLLPVVLSLLVLGAHFFRAGSLIMVAAVLIVLGMLALRRRWAARVVQVALLLGAVEWVLTLTALYQERVAAGRPALRMSLILGGVAVLTALAALMFRTARLRNRYR